MSKRRVYLTPMEADAELDKARAAAYFTDETEKAAIKTMVETAMCNGRMGYKTILVLNPIYIRIPKWQRKLSIPRALAIGNQYNKYKMGSSESPLSQWKILLR